MVYLLKPTSGRALAALSSTLIIKPFFFLCAGSKPPGENKEKKCEGMVY